MLKDWFKLFLQKAYYTDYIIDVKAKIVETREEAAAWYK